MCMGPTPSGDQIRIGPNKTECGHSFAHVFCMVQKLLAGTPASALLQQGQRLWLLLSKNTCQPATRQERARHIWLARCTRQVSAWLFSVVHTTTAANRVFVRHVRALGVVFLRRAWLADKRSVSTP